MAFCRTFRILLFSLVGSYVSFLFFLCDFFRLYPACCVYVSVCNFSNAGRCIWIIVRVYHSERIHMIQNERETVTKRQCSEWDSIKQKITSKSEKRACKWRNYSRMLHMLDEIDRRECEWASERRYSKQQKKNESNLLLKIIDRIRGLI